MSYDLSEGKLWLLPQRFDLVARDQQIVHGSDDTATKDDQKLTLIGTSEVVVSLFEKMKGCRIIEV